MNDDRLSNKAMHLADDVIYCWHRLKGYESQLDDMNEEDRDGHHGLIQHYQKQIREIEQRIQAYLHLGGLKIVDYTGEVYPRDSGEACQFEELQTGDQIVCSACVGTGHRRQRRKYIEKRRCFFGESQFPRRR